MEWNGMEWFKVEEYGMGWNIMLGEMLDRRIN